MAEQERRTNKERREAARQERKAREAEAARRAKKSQLKGTLITVVVVLVVGAVVFQAFFRGGGPVILEDTITIASDEAEAAREEAGCEVLTERDPLPDRQHFEAAAAPDPSTIYTDGRPTHSGPHNVRQLAVSPDGFSSQVSETSTTHNLEHGSIIVWYDPAQAGDQEAEIASWVETLNASGFDEPAGRQAGAGIFRSPYEDPGITSGQAIAFRAWGTAMDCDTFDETVANAFVAENFGTRGIGPESVLGGYPEGVIEFSDREIEEEERNEPVPGGDGVGEPIDPEDAPTDGEDAPAEDSDDAPAEETPADGEDAPADDGDAPAEETPADDGEEAPADDTGS